MQDRSAFPATRWFVGHQPGYRLIGTGTRGARERCLRRRGSWCTYWPTRSRGRWPVVSAIRSCRVGQGATYQSAASSHSPRQRSNTILLTAQIIQPAEHKIAIRTISAATNSIAFLLIVQHTFPSGFTAERCVRTTARNPGPRLRGETVPPGAPWFSHRVVYAYRGAVRRGVGPESPDSERPGRPGPRGVHGRTCRTAGSRRRAPSFRRVATHVEEAHFTNTSSSVQTIYDTVGMRLEPCPGQRDGPGRRKGELVRPGPRAVPAPPAGGTASCTPEC